MSEVESKLDARDARAFLDGAPPSENHRPPRRPTAGRPPFEYTADIAAAICARLGDGEKLHTICKTEGMPCAATVYRWLATNAEFRFSYQCALQAKFDARAEELIDIADDASSDVEIVDGADGMPVAKPDKTAIARSELMIKTRQWVMAKELPQKYADLKLPDTAAPTPPDAGTPAQLPKPEDDPLHLSFEAWRAAGEGHLKKK